MVQTRRSLELLARENLSAAVQGDEIEDPLLLTFKLSRKGPEDVITGN